MIRLRACRLPGRPGLQELILQKGRIAAIQVDAASTPDRRGVDLSAQGRLVTPGLIDVHTHGTGGAEVFSGSAADLQRMALTLAQQGVTAFLATTICHRPTAHAHLRNAADFISRQSKGGARCLGIHLEGPYISVKRRGGIDPASIDSPATQSLDELLEICAGSLRMMTLAPELPGHLELVEQLVRHQVIPSLGHTDASYAQAFAGFKAGIQHATHLFNAMPPLLHRAPGCVAAVFTHPTVTAQIISDGVHVHPEIVNLTYRLLGAERCVLITDGMQASGLPDGRYVYADKEYETRNGTARYLDGTLIGSTLSLIEMTLRFRKCAGCSLEVALQCASRNPARVLGLADRKGAILPGYDADLVVWNDDFSVYATLINGEVVYRRGGPASDGRQGGNSEDKNDPVIHGSGCGL
ncbi:N-acetylglucosamine-6-phosphate deacetylase [bacterium]|nr:N-acetylglucosamine-6-phosphate deacetylase [bacterium]